MILRLSRIISQSRLGVSNMQSIFGDLKGLLKTENVATDNFVFRLHYKCTLLLLVACTALLGAKQYFGDPIDCYCSREIPNGVLDAYCWINATWTVKGLTEDLYRGWVVHPGVGPYTPNEEQIHHSYYQWVPLALGIAAATFYIPRMLWKSHESGFMAHVCGGMKFRPINGKDVDRMALRLRFFLFHVDRRIHRSYTWWFFMCECLNLINVVGQWILTNWFLNGGFHLYGAAFVHYYFNSRMHGGDRNDLSSPLDLVFPKVTMCEFWEHGQTGQHQTCSATCILPLNIVNEKLYIVLWFWYVFIIAMSLLVVIYRIVSFTTKALRRIIARLRMRHCDYAVLRSVVTSMTVSEYFLLKQFSRNVDPAIFTALLNALYHGRRRLTESEILFMEDEKSTEETKPEDMPEPKALNGKMAGALRIRLPVDPAAVDSRTSVTAATAPNSSDLYHDALDGNRHMP